VKHENALAEVGVEKQGVHVSKGHNGRVEWRDTLGVIVTRIATSQMHADDDFMIISILRKQILDNGQANASSAIFLSQDEIDIRYTVLTRSVLETGVTAIHAQENGVRT